MRETIIRFDDELDVTIDDFSVQERYVDVSIVVNGALVLPGDDPLPFTYRADRRLNWVGDDHGGGWNHFPLTDANNSSESTQIYVVDEWVVLPEHWAEVLAAMAFAPKIDYDAITRKLIADLQAHVDPAQVFLGALRGSLAPA
ncbi:gp73 [Rhodococcus phage ReqiPine5]|uniref:Gp73 n=1 Tax=Rhodococcus phage ReqiPine5 TaxID=691963 RepID=D4P848_9CAUD|nr:gp73 [Rhodococcus phage ReqiPine5]ADD81178.1 gp73 [Rhodococcus phage ReqiPine5]